ncbi:MAG TPA: hypothetical protein VL995_03230 [Cellvibrio sp.]|nr:hypothetical protein [Cellvibrio sp.]
MKFLPHASHRLQALADSDTASWVLVYSVSALSLCVSLLLIASLGYFSI